jgi:hypothetical protein
MRRKAVHLLAAIAESLRFFAVVFLAFSVGALLDPGAASLLRYAAVPQLLFAAGFFFMWLDPERYSSYRPLLAIGKAALVVSFLPMAAALMRDAGATGATFGLPFLGIILAFFIALVDLACLCVLALASPREAPPSARNEPIRRADVGQSPEDIEQVEG